MTMNAAMISSAAGGQQSPGRQSGHTAPHQCPRPTTTARPLRGQPAIAATAPTTRFCAPGLNNYGVTDPIQIGGSGVRCADRRGRPTDRRAFMPMCNSGTDGVTVDGVASPACLTRSF
jgi:hypothetical protein